MVHGIFGHLSNTVVCSIYIKYLGVPIKYQKDDRLYLLIVLSTKIHKVIHAIIFFNCSLATKLLI